MNILKCINVTPFFFEPLVILPKDWCVFACLQYFKPKFDATEMRIYLRQHCGTGCVLGLVGGWAMGPPQCQGLFNTPAGV